tara:strand:- start:268 stop:714 length:447 start_codon:yes stop_codon:yes gene_type:complete
MGFFDFFKKKDKKEFEYSKSTAELFSERDTYYEELRQAHRQSAEIKKHTNDFIERLKSKGVSEEHIKKRMTQILNRSQSTGHDFAVIENKFNFKNGEKIIVCLGTLDNSCKKMRPSSLRFRCPDMCGGTSFVERTYEGAEWAKENGYR